MTTSPAAGTDPERPNRTGEDGVMHPFVALMRRYCIDYTNSHDQSTYPDLFEEDYTVHIEGFHLVRDESYGPAAARLFARAPGLGLVVHELVLGGDRLAMRFSEHGALSTPAGWRLACWGGIGLYGWNGRRLTENHVEQDFAGRRRQLDSGGPDRLEPPHIDPWTTTRPVPPDPAAEAAVRAWLARGRLHDAPWAMIDTTVWGTGTDGEGPGHAPGAGVGAGAEVVDEAGGVATRRTVGGERRAAEPLVIEARDVMVNDLFSAGRRVAFHITLQGPYRGGLDGVDPAAVGRPVSLHVAGLVRVDRRGRVEEVRAVTSRRAASYALRTGHRATSEAAAGNKVLFEP